MTKVVGEHPPKPSWVLPNMLGIYAPLYGAIILLRQIDRGRVI